jgi:DNA helicase-2/ATP-dependent DNA helicase PcrA
MARSAFGGIGHKAPSRFLADLPSETVRWERTAAGYTTWSGGRAGVGAYGERRPERDRSTRNSTFVGGTPKAREMAARLGIDASKLATASELGRQAPPVQLEAGDRITHQRYGLGRVTAVDGGKAQIDFGDQVMWIVLRGAPIEKL